MMGSVSRMRHLSTLGYSLSCGSGLWCPNSCSSSYFILLKANIIPIHVVLFVSVAILCRHPLIGNSEWKQQTVCSFVAFSTPALHLSGSKREFFPIISVSKPDCRSGCMSLFLPKLCVM